jgi:hypothetical protein
MTAFTERTFPREHQKAHVKYAEVNVDNYYDCLMCNYSKGGMYLESLHPSPPESDICIVMQNYCPAERGPESFKAYIATVKWCEQITTAEMFRYGFGVQIYARSHKATTNDPEVLLHPCDYCHNLFTINFIHRADDYVYLCTTCLNHFQIIHNQETKDSIERMLIGNVI